jgi:hypothetical protein
MTGAMCFRTSSVKRLIKLPVAVRLALVPLGDYEYTATMALGAYGSAGALVYLAGDEFVVTNLSGLP